MSDTYGYGEMSLEEKAKWWDGRLCGVDDSHEDLSEFERRLVADTYLKFCDKYSQFLQFGNGLADGGSE